MKSLRFSALGILAALILMPSRALPEELRKCTNSACKKYAVSATWKFCPFCATVLPVLGSGQQAAKESTLGNIYQNPAFRFQVEKPNEDWKFLTKGGGLDELNRDAAIGMTSADNLFSVVIAEKAPGVSLEDFCKLAQPRVEAKVKVYEKPKQRDGLSVVETKWQVEFNDVQFVFYYTITAKDDWKYQIIQWCVEGSDGEETQALFQAVSDSFKIL